MSVGENKYVALTTFTKDGRRKNCPVWIVDLGEGQVGFTTESTSWKAKRIMNSPAVELIASNSRGEPLEGHDMVQGTARIAHGDEYRSVETEVKEKIRNSIYVDCWLWKANKVPSQKREFKLWGCYNY